MKTMQDFDSYNYRGSVLNSIERVGVKKPGKCVKKIEVQLADFILLASFSQEGADSRGTKYKCIDMSSDPIHFNTKKFGTVRVLRMLEFVTSKKTDHIIVITSHLVLDCQFVDWGWTGDQSQWYNPHIMLETCDDWVNFRKTFAKSPYNRK